MKTIQLSEQKAQQLYKTASPEFKQLLEENFSKEVLSGKITDRVKTWTDIRDILGGINLPWGNPLTKEQVAQNAFAKMQAISKVLNEGWEPDFNNTNEYKWYPYFEKKSAGWVFGGSRCLSWVGYMGSGFYFKTRELAEYAGNQFLDIYREYLPK